MVSPRTAGGLNGSQAERMAGCGGEMSPRVHGFVRASFHYEYFLVLCLHFAGRVYWRLYTLHIGLWSALAFLSCRHGLGLGLSSAFESSFMSLRRFRRVLGVG
jgi:hypothetical protein